MSGDERILDVWEQCEQARTAWLAAHGRYETTAHYSGHRAAAKLLPEMSDAYATYRAAYDTAMQTVLTDPDHCAYCGRPLPGSAEGRAFCGQGCAAEAAARGCA